MISKRNNGSNNASLLDCLMALRMFREGCQDAAGDISECIKSVSSVMGALSQVGMEDRTGGIIFSSTRNQVVDVLQEKYEVIAKAFRLAIKVANGENED